MLFSIVVPLATQGLIVLGLLVWLGFSHPTSRSGIVLSAALVATYIVAIALGGLWLVLPWFTPAIYAVLFLLALRRALRRRRPLPALPPTLRSRAGVAALMVLLTIVVGLTAAILDGRRMPDRAVTLSFPLRGGAYLVVNGGGNQLISAHLQTLKEERFRRWRGQSYGVDIVKVNGLGLRASGILPTDPAEYEIFGAPLHAPCGGEVVAAIDGLRDMPPPRADRRNMAGNHVILRCRDAWIFLGHLQQGSVTVRPGSTVAVGQLIGRVGNTGNTFEPHLHIHAQTPGSADGPLSGQPRHIRFDDRYPRRNDRF